ncbi:MAG: radical SAM protein [Lachnospiraceae bacterium]|jgi:Fe-S oxidoreductase|nr:radical SAM protein [Lachnospiraceae bacterium]
MHYTGTIWRPPYEAGSLLLEVTAGCTHHKCKFCTLYNDLPFTFRLSPLEDIEADLQEAAKRNRMWGWKDRRVFLTGANPFVLRYTFLMEIAGLVKKYFPSYRSIGSFARITDISMKSDKELIQLKKAGFNGLTIGMETADDKALGFMNKGYSKNDILVQCRRLEQAGISYKFFYLVGISGKNKGTEGAKVTAEICNQLHPELVGANMLTIYKNSLLYQEIRKGNWRPESEMEKYKEMKTLVKNLSIETEFAAMGASNAVQLYGILPKDRMKLLSVLDGIIDNVDEKELEYYRKNLRHL